MNEREKNKELIQRMAETLRNHIEPYKEGAWERFSAKHGKARQRTIGWPYWGAAAVLLLVAGLYIFEKQVDVPEIVQGDIPSLPITREPATPSENSGQTQAVERSVQSVASGQSPEAVLQIPKDERMSDFGKGQAILAVKGSEVSAIAVQDTAVIRDAPGGQAIAAVDVHDTADSVPLQRLAVVTEQHNPKPHNPEQPGDRLRDNDILNQETTVNGYAVAAASAENSARKWDLGVVVSPSLTSERVNMGGGIAVAYRLSDKFSLGSGVSIGELGVAQNSNGPQAAAYGFEGRYADFVAGGTGLQSSYESYKEVTSVTSTVLALDIPLNLQYNVTERFYTTVGVSFVNVLNEKRTAHFVDRLNDPTFGQKNSTESDILNSVRAVHSTENTGYHPLEGRGYAGFLNFSVGRRVPLSRKLSLSVEPYFKLPVGRLSREEMDFTNGGIRIVTGF